MTASDLAAALGGRRQGDGWMACCPAHDDRNPSLSITERDGKVLMHCFAGCSYADVAAAVDLGNQPTSAGSRALAQSRRRPRRPAQAQVRRTDGVVTRYEVRDRTGACVAVHLRYDYPEGVTKKNFLWQLPDGTPGLGGRKSAELPLYRGERLAGAVLGATVIVVEGERAADSLSVLGVAVVGTVTGASTIPADDVLEVLRGFEVVLWPDHDSGGRRHMQHIAMRLEALGISVSMLTWAGARDRGDDAANFIERGGTADELAVMISEARYVRESCGAVVEDAKGANSSGSRLAPFVVLSSLKRRPVPWLWQDKIPLGRPTILEGDPDTGKSTLAFDIAARVTTGRAMPCEECPLLPAAGVVILSAEDDAADTIRPRLEAAGGDLDLVAVFKIENLPDLDEQGLTAIERAITSVGAKLVIVDPLMAFVPDQKDTHRDHHMRRALRPLSALCERTGVATLVIRHLNKSGGTNAKYRGGGSIGLTGAARSVMLAAPDPDHPNRRVLARVKCNIAPPWPSLAYELVPAEGCAVVEWTGESGHTADDLLGPAPETSTQIDEAIAFLKVELSGGARPQTTLRRAARDAGISERTLDRAKVALRVKSRKAGFSGGWLWALPIEFATATGTNPAEGCQLDKGELGTLRPDTAPETGAGMVRGVL